MFQSDKINKRRGHLFFPETKLKACERLKKGESASKIAKELGAHLGTVQKWYRDYVKKGKPVQSEKYKKSKMCSREQMLEACELLKQGHPTIFVAKKFGVARSTVQCWRHKYAPESWTDRRYSWKFDSDKILRACDLLKKGYTVASVARKIGVSRGAVQQWRVKYLKEIEDTRESNTTGKYDKWTMLRACTRLRQGIAMNVVARELNVDERVLKKWASQNYLLKKSEVIEDSRGFDRSIIRRVCERLQQGETPLVIGKKLGINRQTIYNWKERYLVGPRRELRDTRDGHKYKRQTVLEACKLLKQGVSTRNVAKRLNVNYGVIMKWRTRYVKGQKSEPTYQSLKAYLHLIKDTGKYDKNTIIEACELLRQGTSTTNTSKKLNVPVDQVVLWRQRFLLGRKRVYKPDNVTSRRRKKYERYKKATIFKVCKLLRQGAKIRPLSRQLGIGRKTIQRWYRKYVTEKSRKIPAKTWLKIGALVNDEKLMGNPVVVLTKDPKIDRLCPGVDASNKSQERNGNKKRKLSKTFVPLRKVYISKEMKLQFVKLIIEEGVLVADLSRKLNINGLTLQSWVMNRELLDK